MTLEHVQQEILHNAEQEAKQILANAKESARKEREQTEKIADTLERQTHEILEKEKEITAKRIAVNKKLIVRKVLLEKRKELLEETFQETKNILQNIPRAEKLKILHHLFDNAKKEMSIGKLYVGSQDMEIIKTFGVAVCEEHMLGGIIAENKEGTVRIDYSFDALFKEIEEKKRHDVTQLLFENK